MKATTAQSLPYDLIGVSSLIGRVVSIEQWAERAR